MDLEQIQVDPYTKDMSEANLQQVRGSLGIIDQLLPILDEAEHDLKSAKNWGFADIFFGNGGGLISDMFKHMKLNSAKNNMNQVQYLMGQLQGELQKIIVPADYRMNLNGFVTFADFFWDGAIVDVYMQYKILSSIKEVQKLQEKLRLLREKLIDFSRL